MCLLCVTVWCSLVCRGGRVVEAHKLVLSAHSPVFRAMLNLYHTNQVGLLCSSISFVACQAGIKIHYLGAGVLARH